MTCPICRADVLPKAYEQHLGQHVTKWGWVKWPKPLPYDLPAKSLPLASTTKRRAAKASLVLLAWWMSACSAWRPRDVFLGGLSTAAISADVGTTIVALRNPLAVERNPLLGEHPAPAKVVVLGAWGAALTLGVAELLPEKARPWWLGSIAVICLSQAVRNAR